MDVAWTLLESSLKALALWLVCLISRKVLDRIMSEKCLINKCARSAGAATRGLCLVCWSKAKSKVGSGQTSWEQLESAGLVLPLSAPFDDAFDDKFPREHVEEEK